MKRIVIKIYINRNFYQRITFYFSRSNLKIDAAVNSYSSEKQ